MQQTAPHVWIRSTILEIPVAAEQYKKDPLGRAWPGRLLRLNVPLLTKAVVEP